MVLTWNIETIKDFGGTNEASSLEQIVADFEKDVGEWRHRNSSNLTPFVEEKLRHLSEHMQKTYAETQREVKTASQELKSLETKKVKIVDVIDSSNSALADTNEQFEKAKVMMKRANFLISKVRLVRTEEIARLEQLSAERDQVFKLEAEKKAALAETHDL